MSDKINGKVQIEYYLVESNDNEYYNFANALNAKVIVPYVNQMKENKEAIFEGKIYQIAKNLRLFFNNNDVEYIIKQMIDFRDKSDLAINIDFRNAIIKEYIKGNSFRAFIKYNFKEYTVCNDDAILTDISAVNKGQFEEIYKGYKIIKTIKKIKKSYRYHRYMSPIISDNFVISADIIKIDPNDKTIPDFFIDSYPLNNIKEYRKFGKFENQIYSKRLDYIGKRLDKLVQMHQIFNKIIKETIDQKIQDFQIKLDEITQLINSIENNYSNVKLVFPNYEKNNNIDNAFLAISSNYNKEINILSQNCPWIKIPISYLDKEKLKTQFNNMLISSNDIEYIIPNNVMKRSISMAGIMKIQKILEEEYIKAKLKNI